MGVDVGVQAALDGLDGVGEEGLDGRVLSDEVDVEEGCDLSLYRSL